MEKPDIHLKKIDLNNFIEVLVKLYEQGVNYIDILGFKNEGQDKLGIDIPQEYIDEEAIDFYEQSKNNVIDIEEKLTDKDLNDLI